MGKLNKRETLKDSYTQNFPKKIKLDEELLNSNFKGVEKNTKIKNHKLKKKPAETFNAIDSDVTVTSNSESACESDSNHTLSNKKLDMDKNSDASDKNYDSEIDVTTDNLCIDLDEKKIKKKMQTVDSLLKLGFPSSEELKYRMEKKDLGKMDNFNTFTCTKCNFNFNKMIKKYQKISIHPLLGVLMCEKCCNYYGDGDFSLDSDNEDKYCRWCGEGGTIFSCSNCICGFCKKCITKHFGKKIATEIEFRENWSCYFCNIKPLWKLRYICSLAVQKCEEMNNSKENKKATSPPKKKRRKVLVKRELSSSNSDSESDKNHKRKKANINFEAVKTNNKRPKLNTSKNMESDLMVDTSVIEDETDNENNKNNKNSKVKPTTVEKTTSSSDSDDSSSFKSKRRIKKKSKMTTSTPKKNESNSDSNDSSSFDYKKRKVLNELENILKLTEYQMSFGSKWSSKKLVQISKPSNLNSETQLKKECQKIKWFLSTLCSYIVGFCNAVDSIEKSFVQEEEKPSEEEKNTMTDPSYALVLKFLSFATNLVKVFDQKNIDFAHLMNSEMYEDENVLGLEKKSKSPTSDEEKVSEKDDTSYAKNDEKRDEKNDLVEKNLELLFNSSADNTVSPATTED